MSDQTLVVFSIVSSITVGFTCLAYVSMYSFAQEKSLLHSHHESVPTTYSSVESSSIEAPILEADNDMPQAESEGKGHTDQGDCSFFGCLIPTGATLFLCLVGFIAAFGEGGIVTWSIVYMNRYITSSTDYESLGFTCFMLCMAGGRFCVDYIRRKIGRQMVVKISGVLAMGGLGIVVLAPYCPNPIRLGIACLGFCGAGCGLATLIPTMFSSAGHLPGVHAGTGLATVAAFSYSGSIVSSTFIGFLSDMFNSLQYSLAVCAVLLGLCIPLGFFVPPEEKTSLRGDGDGQSNSASEKVKLLDASNFDLTD